MVAKKSGVDFTLADFESTACDIGVARCLKILQGELIAQVVHSVVHFVQQV